MHEPIVRAASPLIRLFGTPALVDGAGRVQPLPAPAANVLAYILLYPTSIGRERLAEALWPDQPEGYARRRLSDALYRLRQQINPNWIVVTATTLSPGPDVPAVDLWVFEQLVTSRNPADLQHAVALYQADLLADLDAEWALPRRTAARELFLDCLLRLGQSAEADNQPGSAAAYYRSLTDEDPLREEAHQGLMRCLAHSGRHIEALEAYSRLERLLDAELGLPPTAASTAMAAQIRSERDVAAQNATDSADRFVRPPFVGRIAERAWLLERLDQVRTGRGGLMLLLGEAGIGKSRLLAELATAATWRGWQVATGRGDETRTGAVLTEALTGAVRGPRVQQLARLVAPPLRAIAARIIPALEPDAPALPESIGREQLAAALAAVLAGLGKIAPHLFIFDDIHWATPDLWPLLAELTPLLVDVPVLLVLAGREEELRAQPAWQWIEAWDAAGAPRLRLDGLGPEALAELVQACMPSTGVRSQESGVRSQESGEQSSAIERLNAASNGNPLIALTLLREQALDNPTPPPSLTELVGRRLALLSPDARRIAQAAAVLGSRVDYALWEATLATVNLAPEQLPPLAGELERSGFLVPEETGYRFAHDTLRSAIYAQLPGASRRRWHTFALADAQRLYPHDARLQLYHAVGAAEPHAIARAALAAGAQALQSLAPTTAVQFFTQALTVLPETALKQRYTALLGRARAHAILADTTAQTDDLSALAEIADALADPPRRLEVLRLQVELAWTLGQLDAAEALAMRGRELARTIGDPASEAALLEASGRIARHRGAFDEAEALYRRAQEQYTALDDQLGEATITDLLGGVAWSRGDYAHAVALHAAASDRFHALGASFHEARALNRLGSAYWGLGDFLAARATHERSLAVCRANGDRLGASDNLDNLGGVAWVLGDYPTAISYYEQALALRRAANNAWGISISLGNLGSAYRLQGAYATALEKYAEALAVNRTMGRRPGEGYVQHGRGLTFLDLGQIAEARAALEEAYAIRCTLTGRDGRIDTTGALALLRLAEGNCAAARRIIDEALELLRADDRAPLRQWIHYIAFRICTTEERHAAAREHLQLAHQAMHDTGTKLPPPERAAFISRVPLNRDVEAALNALATICTARLVRAATPLGRNLTPADYIDIRWTLATPADELITPAEARRRTVLARLIAEAQAQGAAPTDSDLADALGVSRRTILRDIAALSAEGVQLPTRRRQKK
jgi:DNA-binding SARP family transcriptional activator